MTIRETDTAQSAFLKQQPVKMLIGGQWVESASGKTFDTINPSTGEVLAKVAEGDDEDINRAVAALAAHPDVDKIAFTGSTEVGKKILLASAGNLKRVTLELGGKSPNIIFPDADMKFAIRGAMNAIFFNQGQVCTAGSRLFVQKSVYDAVLSGVTDYASKMKIGSGIDPNTELGPLVSQEQLERVTGYIEAGKREGAKPTTGGERAGGELANGYFVQPTIFDNVHDDMTIAREEIFGPVVVALPFEDVEEVAARANKSVYGLAAGVWTNDVKKAHKVAAALKSGVVWVNTYNQFDAAAPFGGYKQSGYGREMGHAVLDAYTQVKTVWVNLR